ncbi:MAG TPA: hypothetical protein VN606_14040 [Thermoleophilaceae bacterium]|jgi:hypothetical protein|nr:hypothetical protein [Thermoleophilaceae bacterium]
MGDTVATVDAAPQHLRALEHANKVRLARAQLKRQIAEQELSVVEVILNCPWEAASMSVSDLLMSQRRWGRARCRRLLVSLGITENKQIGTFTERQRAALAAVLSAKTGTTRPEGGAPAQIDRERRFERVGSHSTSRAAVLAG